MSPQHGKLYNTSCIFRCVELPDLYPSPCAPRRLSLKRINGWEYAQKLAAILTQFVRGWLEVMGVTRHWGCIVKIRLHFLGCLLVRLINLYFTQGRHSHSTARG